mmetsp:Transcript_63312/g.119919  ORF Transcript_63312/g.119919 Transcript_63312/m.119919 type:complete len:90 (-) Transcript_63312:752-1021(-)
MVDPIILHIMKLANTNPWWVKGRSSSFKASVQWNMKTFIVDSTPKSMAPQRSTPGLARADRKEIATSPELEKGDCSLEIADDLGAPFPR